MSGYRLSDRAEGELREIFDYSAQTFGMRRAERYLHSFGRCFALLAAYPHLGRVVRPLKSRRRRYNHGSHVILYTVADDGVTVLAIIHGRASRRRLGGG